MDRFTKYRGILKIQSVSWLLEQRSTNAANEVQEREKTPKEGDPPTTQASSAEARSSCPRGASRAQGAGASKIR